MTRLYFFAFIFAISASFGCADKKSKKRVFVPQDLSKITQTFKNGCFRLKNTRNETVYLYIDEPSVEAIDFFSLDDTGTSHVDRVRALTTDGRIYTLRELIVDYDNGSTATFSFGDVPEDIKALEITGHSNAFGGGGQGRQRVNVGVLVTDEENYVIPHNNCNPKDNAPEVTEALADAFHRGFPVN